jgi:hypothetical protein
MGWRALLEASRRLSSHLAVSRDLRKVCWAVMPLGMDSMDLESDGSSELCGPLPCTLAAGEIRLARFSKHGCRHASLARILLDGSNRKQLLSRSTQSSSR